MAPIHLPKRKHLQIKLPERVDALFTDFADYLGTSKRALAEMYIDETAQAIDRIQAPMEYFRFQQVGLCALRELRDSPLNKSVGTSLESHTWNIYADAAYRLELSSVKIARTAIYHGLTVNMAEESFSF